MCGSCGGRSTAVRVVRNVPKASREPANAVIIVRQTAGKATRPKRLKSYTLTGGVRTARSGG